MKTTRYYTVIMIILAIVFAVNLSASSSMVTNSGNPPESLLNNYDLNTGLMSEFDFEDESYIDDIPFDTECVSKNCIYQKAISMIFDFEEETYVDDIPFATESIAMNCVFSFEDESYIDDIPFDTKKIAKHSNRNQYVYNQ